MSEQKRAVVKWFQNTKGYGFLTPLDGGPEVFVHYSGIHAPTGSSSYKSLNEGDTVEYETIQSEKGTKAVNVRKI